MAERVIQQTVTVAPGTPASAPETTALNFGSWNVEAIDLEAPPGFGGAVGFYLANNGYPMIPRTPGEWLIWDDKIERFPATDYPTGGGWQLVAYNVGAIAHNVVVRFHVNQLGTPGPAYGLPSLTFIETDVAETAVVVL